MSLQHTWTLTVQFHSWEVHVWAMQVCCHSQFEPTHKHGVGVHMGLGGVCVCRFTLPSSSLSHSTHTQSGHTLNTRIDFNRKRWETSYNRIEFFNPELRAVVDSVANTLLTHCSRIQLSVMKAHFIHTPASRIMSSVFFMEQGREPGYNYGKHYSHCKIQRELIQK